MDNRLFAEINEASNSRKKSLPSKLSPSNISKKSVQCYECGFSCTSYAQLKVHNRIHTGDKPYACPDCNYASTRNANLQRHIQSMHAGQQSSPATGKPGPPALFGSPQQNTDINTIHNPLQNFTSYTRQNSVHPPNFLDSISPSQRVKSPLSEIRARELMLAENVVHHDRHLPLDVSQRAMDAQRVADAQRVMDVTLRPRLIHPASQVLSLPPQFPLTQDSVSSFSSSSVVEEPILIDDDPVVEDDDTYEARQPEQSLEPVPQRGMDATLRPRLIHPVSQVQVDPTMLLPNDRILPDAQPQPVLETSTSSPDVIPIHVPTIPPLIQQNQGYSCIVNNSLRQVGHKLPVVEKEIEHTTTSSESLSSLLFPPNMPNTGSDLASGTKIHQKHPLVLEIENSNIGLYLHLDLSKYICEAAQKWLSRHTRDCNGVCRANFPLNTTSPPDDAQPSSIETDLKDDQEVLPAPLLPIPTPPIHIPTPSIPISTQVPTISRAPPLIPSNTPAFPTAILAVPQLLPANDEVKEHTTQHPDLPIFSKANIPSVSCEKAIATNQAMDVPQVKPMVMNSVDHSSSNLVRHSSSNLVRHSSSNLVKHSSSNLVKHSLSNFVKQSSSNTHAARRHQNKSSSGQDPPASAEPSLIFQRWPTLRQYMQVRCLANNQKEFSCYKCGKQFSELHQLKVHVKNHIKRYNCTDCHYSTHRMANLKRHQLTHRQVNELTCQVCSAVLANKRAYTMHVLFSHKKHRARANDFDVWRRQFAVTAHRMDDVQMKVVSTAQSGMNQLQNGGIITDKSSSGTHEIEANITETSFAGTGVHDNNGETDSHMEHTGEENPGGQQSQDDDHSSETGTNNTPVIFKEEIEENSLETDPEDLSTGYEQEQPLPRGMQENISDTGYQVTDDNPIQEATPDESANHNQNLEESANCSQNLEESANHSPVPVKSTNGSDDIESSDNHSENIELSASHSEGSIASANHSEGLIGSANQNCDTIKIKEELPIDDME